VGPCVARFAHDVFRLDHLLDARTAWIVCDVDNVDARRAETGHDQMRALRSVAGRAAPVPAVVVKLIADVRHWRLMDDSPIFRIDYCEEVGCGNPSAFVQAPDVQEFLSGRPKRLFW